MCNFKVKFLQLKSKYGQWTAINMELRTRSDIDDERKHLWMVRKIDFINKKRRKRKKEEFDELINSEKKKKKT